MGIERDETSKLSLMNYKQLTYTKQNLNKINVFY